MSVCQCCSAVVCVEVGRLLPMLVSLCCSAVVSISVCRGYSAVVGVSVVTLVSCSFDLCGQGSSLLWTPALRPYSGSVRLPRERQGIGRCVQCV